VRNDFQKFSKIFSENKAKQKFEEILLFLYFRQTREIEYEQKK